MNNEWKHVNSLKDEFIKIDETFGSSQNFETRDVMQKKSPFNKILGPLDDDSVV